jgi:hypothetical protein
MSVVMKYGKVGVSVVNFDISQRDLGFRVREVASHRLRQVVMT